MDLPGDTSAMEPSRVLKKRRVELPLKKRYQNQDTSSFSSLDFINRNTSPTDDRASSDDSALPKTPCSGQSTSSLEPDECPPFPLDFTLPNRSRAKLRFNHHKICKQETLDHDGIDNGFESASTSSATSVQEEPLDLTEKSPSDSADHRSRAFDLNTAILSSYPLGLFGNGLLAFPTAQIDQSPKSLPGPAFPIFSPQIVSGNQSIPSGPSSASKRPRLASTKSGKQSESSKIASDHLITSATAHSTSSFSAIDACNEAEDDVLFNKLRRNYKNMTIERRMEANARERTRVHTIGAAFDRLRKLIPSSTADQKLSKLSILRIACRYIMLLASMNGLDYSLEQRGYSVEECIDMLTDTVNMESKYKRVP